MRLPFLATCIALCLAGPARAEVLGRMTLTLDGRTASYRVLDSAGAASGWQRAQGQMSVLLNWQGRVPTDRLVLQLTLADGKPVAARLEMPEAGGGALAATAPDSLTVALGRATLNGPWLKLSGRLTGTLHPRAAANGTLTNAGHRLRGGFSAWVPGILAPEKPVATTTPKPRPAKKK